MNEDDEFDFDTEDWNYINTDPYLQEFIPNKILSEDTEYDPYDF
jgi:hypothetical protein